MMSEGGESLRATVLEYTTSPVPNENSTYIIALCACSKGCGPRMICMLQSAPVFCQRTTMAFYTLQIFFYVMQKNLQSVKFVDDWMEAAKDYHLISDEPSQKPNFAGFKQHKRDQSALSLLIRCAYGELRNFFLYGHPRHISACTRFNYIWPNEWTPGRVYGSSVETISVHIVFPLRQFT
jgi:hypothetical protein